MKRYILIAGVNGAGKSTFYNSQMRRFDKISRVNMDEILAEMIQSSKDWNDPSSNILAGQTAVRLIQTHFQNGDTFNQETTLCGHSILRNIELARKSNYIVQLHYIGLESPEIAKDRVHQRVQRGGHGLPDSLIEKRYYESFKNCREIIPYTDLAAFYDNTEELRRFAIFRKGNLERLSHQVPGWFVKYIQ